MVGTTVIVTNSFDARDLLTSVLEGGRTTSFGYAADGLPTSQTNYNGTQQAMTYDNARRPLTTANTWTTSPGPNCPQGADVASFSASLNAIGSRTTLTRTARPRDGDEVSPDTCGGASSTKITTYEYDGMSRLTKERDSASGDGGQQRF